MLEPKQEPRYKVRLLCLLPGLGHIYTGYRIKGIIWLMISFPILVIFLIDMYKCIIFGFLSFFTLEAIIFAVIYGVMVYLNIHEIGQNIADEVNTQRLVDYFEQENQRKKELAEKYKKFYYREPEKKSTNDILNSN